MNFRPFSRSTASLRRNAELARLRASKADGASSFVTPCVVRDFRIPARQGFLTKNKFDSLKFYYFIGVKILQLITLNGGSLGSWVDEERS